MEPDDSGWSTSASAWIASVDGFEYTRSVILDHVMLDLCGKVSGLKVIDIGCGEGRSSRMLAESGARVIGLDPTSELIAEAARRDSASSYIRGSGECVGLRSASVDVAVSYLVLIDIPDFRASIREAFRILKRGGRFVVGNLACHASTTETGWARDENDRRTYFPIIDYLVERRQVVSWKGISVVNYHRPLEAYMDAFLSSGFILRRFLEPAPSLEQVVAHPDWEFDRKVPYVNAMLWEKSL